MNLWERVRVHRDLHVGLDLFHGRPAHDHSVTVLPAELRVVVHPPKSGFRQCSAVVRADALRRRDNEGLTKGVREQGYQVFGRAEEASGWEQGIKGIAREFKGVIANRELQRAGAGGGEQDGGTLVRQRSDIVVSGVHGSVMMSSPGAPMRFIYTFEKRKQSIQTGGTETNLKGKSTPLETSQHPLPREHLCSFPTTYARRRCLAFLKHGTRVAEQHT